MRTITKNQSSTRIGEENNNNDNLKMKIIEYFNASNITVMFEDGTVVKNTTYRYFSIGTIKNKNFPSVYGVGYFGYGKYDNCTTKEQKKMYQTWQGMIERCYSEKYIEKYPTYKDVKVDNKWHNFQNFAEWYDLNYNHTIMKDWELDKDLFSYINNNRIYSDTSCVFLPKHINYMIMKLYDDVLIPMGYYKKGNNYQVAIGKFGKQKIIGTFKTEREAYKKYLEERMIYIDEIIEYYKDIIDNKILIELKKAFIYNTKLRLENIIE